jgi:PDZ domain-containing protein
MPRTLAGRLAWGAVVVLGVVAAFLWLFPSRDYLYVPDAAQPVAGRVKVQDEKPEDGKGAIYFVDVTVRRATWAERLFAFLRPDGATLVDGKQIVPPGSSFEERVNEGLAEMARSEQVAAAVALKEAGFHVAAEPQGALIDAVATDAPAASILKDGDVIVRALGRQVRTPEDLRRAFVGVTPGETITLVLRRSGVQRTVRVKTVPSPVDAKRAIIGIQISQAAEIKLPRKVDIDLGKVGGPSAGLPFALEVLQKLGRDVDHGRRVVATGEIELDGTVAPIGGVKQKVFGARKAGADVFLVPAGENAKEARRYAGNLRIVPVESFQQALSALRTVQGK